MGKQHSSPFFVKHGGILNRLLHADGMTRADHDAMHIHEVYKKHLKAMVRCPVCRCKMVPSYAKYHYYCGVCGPRRGEDRVPTVAIDRRYSSSAVLKSRRENVARLRARERGEM